MYVLVDHAVTHEQMSFQALREIDGGASPVGQAVVKGFVQDGGGVAMVVVGPVRNGPEAGSGLKDVGFGEQGHEGDKPTIGSAIETYVLRVYSFVLHQIFYAVHLVGQVLSSHMAVDGGAPIPAIAGAASVIDV